MDKFNLKEYLANNPLLKENKKPLKEGKEEEAKRLEDIEGGKIEIKFQEWLDIMFSKPNNFDENLTFKTVIEYVQSTLQDYGMDDWQPGQPLPENKKPLKEVMDAFGSVGYTDWGDPVANRQRREKEEGEMTGGEVDQEEEIGLKRIDVIAAIDELNQYLNGNVPKESLIDTLIELVGELKR